MPSVEERLAKIETSFEAFVGLLKVHTKQDMEQFGEIKTILKEIDENVDALRLSEAGRAAVASESKSRAGILGGTVAAFVVGAVEAAKAYFGA